MATPSLPIKPSPWKRVAIVSFFGGVGFVFALALIVGSFVWYNSRPMQPKPWNKAAIIATDSPGFSSSNDGKRVEFTYSVENTTAADYEIKSRDDVKIMVKTTDNILSHPLSEEAAEIRVPVFIPAHEKAYVELSLGLTGIPERAKNETDQQYHERLRGFLRDHLSGVAGFTIFEQSDRYEIDFKKFLMEPPMKKEGGD